MGYQHPDSVLSDDMEDAIRDYLNAGRQPGGFLTAVICNDLKAACSRADEVNLAALPAIVAFLYNEAPAAAWGSREKMDAWIDKRATERETEREEVAEVERRERVQAIRDSAGDYLNECRKDRDG